MLDDLQPVLRHAIMTILVTVYETGFVEELDMADLMRLFGAVPEEGFDTRFSFTDDGWVEAYTDFKFGPEPEVQEFEFEPGTETTLEELEEMADLANWQPPDKSH